MKYLLLVLTALAFALPAAAQRLLSNYANAVAVAGDEILVGEPDNTYRPGTVYIYRRSADGSWSEHGRLTASDADLFDGFGTSLAVDDDRLLVGSIRSNEERGAVYVFERRGGSWIQTGRLTADSATEEGFGSAVALHGKIAVVGAPAATRYGALTPPTSPGAAYIFEADGGDWKLKDRLEGTRIGASFGHAVAVSNATIFVGAPNEGDGTVHVIAPGTETVILSGGSSFGYDLALNDGRLYVGAPGSNAVAVFEPSSGGWAETKRLRPFDGESGFFGASVAVRDGIVWVGAPFHGDRGSIYTIEDSAARRSTPESAPAGGMYGARVALGRDFAVVAVPQGDGLEGTAVALEENRSTVLQGEFSGLDPITGARTKCDDGKASLFPCKKTDLISFLPVHGIGGGRGTRLNDIWGWTDPLTGKEYALVGRTDGTSFIDMSDPANPVYLGSLPLTKGARPTIWRDIKVYKDHAFIVADGTPDHGMQVFDLTLLRNVENPPRIFSETAIYDEIENAHNVAINEETGFAYAVGSNECGGGLHMVDIRDPRKPVYAGCFTHIGTSNNGGGSTHDTQCVIYRGPDREHHGKEICFSSNGAALSIADVTDKANPVAISAGTFPDHAFVHQGWLTEDQRYFYMNDELDEFVGNVPETRTLVWDLLDLEDPQLVKEYTFGVGAADHNLYIRGDYMYQSNYLSGLRIHDISNRENPREVAYFDTVPVGENDSRLDGSWSNYPYFESGVIPVSSKQEGVFFVKMADEPGL